MRKNKQVRIVRTSIPVRKGNGTNDLWYTILYHLQPNSTRNISMALYAYLKKQTNTERVKKQTETSKGKRRQGIEKKKKRSKHALRAQADLKKTRRKARRQEKGRDRELTPTKKRAVLRPASGPRTTQQAQIGQRQTGQGGSKKKKRKQNHKKETRKIWVRQIRQFLTK